MFLDDEKQMIGLCGLVSLKPRYKQNPIEKEIFFNPFQNEMKLAFNFETNYNKNILL